jgi:hypothetical protein
VLWENVCFWLLAWERLILGVTPGEVQPTHDEQMSMLRNLLTDRFKLAFHREQKDFSIYELQVAKNGPKLKPSASRPDEPAVVGPGVVYPPDRVVLPGRNATMTIFVSLLQRATSIAWWSTRPVFPDGMTSIWNGRRTRLSSAGACRRHRKVLRARRSSRLSSSSLV